MLYFWIGVVSILFVFIAIVVVKEGKEVKMNCEVCKFAQVVKLGTKPECIKTPKPITNNDGRCPYFIKQRAK